MHRLSRWIVCFALLLALCLPPRLHAMTAGAMDASHAAHAHPVATPAHLHDDCDGCPPEKSAGAYLACLIACASLPAMPAIPAAQWVRGESERLAPRIPLPTPAREPDILLRPPIAFS